MKQFALFFLFILLWTIAPSVSYGQNFEEKKSLITKDRWSFFDSYSTDNDIVFTQNIKECEKDNYFLFHTDSVTISQGAALCDGEEHFTIRCPWFITEDGETLVFDLEYGSIEFTITSISENELILIDSETKIILKH